LIHFSPKYPHLLGSLLNALFNFFPKMEVEREEFPNSKWPHSHEEIVMRKIFSVRNVTEGYPRSKEKCKLENQVKKGDLSFCREGELDCVCGR
jgi:hypothetical protein